MPQSGAGAVILMAGIILFLTTLIFADTLFNC